MGALSASQYAFSASPIMPFDSLLMHQKNKEEKKRQNKNREAKKPRTEKKKAGICVNPDPMMTSLLCGSHLLWSHLFDYVTGAFDPLGGLFFVDRKIQDDVCSNWVSVMVC